MGVGHVSNSSACAWDSFPTGIPCLALISGFKLSLTVICYMYGWLISLEYLLLFLRKTREI